MSYPSDPSEADSLLSTPDEALSHPESRVLVHCTMGVSRSSTIVCAYLMKARTISVQAALDLVKEKRQGVRPNTGFVRQLGEWEVLLLGKAVSDLDAIF